MVMICCRVTVNGFRRSPVIAEPLGGNSVADPSCELMQPFLREIGQLGSSYMIPIVKWHTDRSRSVWLCKWMAAPRWVQLCCGPFVFVLGGCYARFQSHGHYGVALSHS